MRYLKYIFLTLIILSCCSIAFCEEIKYNPIYGPNIITLHGDIGYLDLPKYFVFFGKEDTIKFFQESKEPYDDSDIGIVIEEQAEDWYALIRYVKTGYIKDDDANRLNSEQLLETIEKNTEEANKKRREMGTPTITVVGWSKIPVYNKYNNTLTWSIIGQGEGDNYRTLNYTSVILGRYGIISLTVIGKYSDSSVIESKMNMLASLIRFTKDNSYKSWVSGDKVSDITLAGLITGGTAAAAYGAAKTGFLTKIGAFFLSILLALKKAIILVIIAIGAIIKGLWGRLRNERNAKQQESDKFNQE